MKFSHALKVSGIFTSYGFLGENLYVLELYVSLVGDLDLDRDLVLVDLLSVRCPSGRGGGGGGLGGMSESV